MSEKVAGVVLIKIDGEQVEIAGKVNFSAATFDRESIVGLSVPSGLFKEIPKVPWVEIEVYKTKALDLDALHAKTNFPVTVEWGEGQSRVLTGASLMSGPEVDLAEGTTTLRFEGVTMEKGSTDAG